MNQSGCRVLRCGFFLLLLALSGGQSGIAADSGISTSADGAQPATISLPEAVRTALASHPEMGMALANQQAGAQELEQARGANRPAVDVRVAAGHERSENATTRATVGGERSLQRDEAGVTVRQNLFDGGQIRGEIVRQQARLAAAGARVEENRESLAFRATDAYLEVLRNQELLRLAEENLKAHRDIMSKSEDRFRSGAGNKADFQLAEGRTALANATQVVRLGAVQESRAKYLRVIGQLPGTLTLPSTRMVLPGSEEMAREMAVGAHPSVAVLRDELNAAKAALAAARARYAPVVDVELGANENRNVAGVTGPNNSATAMLVLRYNLYRGGADEAKVAEMAARELAAGEALNNARRTIEEEVSKAWAAWVAARDSLRYYELHVQMTRDVLEAYRAQFEIGKRTMLDLMNSENELFQARSNLTAGQFNLLLAQHRLLAGVGGLTRTLGVR